MFGGVLGSVVVVGAMVLTKSEKAGRADGKL